jgi:pSer/pThr/pTyr-binding forkhead associated (FHA) protein
MSRLEVVAPATVAAEPFEIWVGAVLIGRGVDADWCLLERTVSRRHALVRHYADHDEIEDLGSTGGTYVNGRRLTGPVTLRHGDRIDLARVQVRYLVDDDATGRTAEVPQVAGQGSRQGWWPF